MKMVAAMQKHRCFWTFTISRTRMIICIGVVLEYTILGLKVGIYFIVVVFNSKTLFLQKKCKWYIFFISYIDDVHEAWTSNFLYLTRGLYYYTKWLRIILCSFSAFATFAEIFKISRISSCFFTESVFISCFLSEMCWVWFGVFRIFCVIWKNKWLLASLWFFFIKW